MTRRIVGVMYKTYVWGVTAVKKPDVVGSNPNVDRFFLNIFKYSVTQFYF